MRYALTLGLIFVMPALLLAAPPTELPSLPHNIPDLALVADRVILNGEARTIRGGDLGIVAVKGDLTLGGKLQALTILVYPTGKLIIEDGTELTFTDRPIDTQRDPEQWGHGLVVFGKWIAKGRPKTPYARATGGLPAGTTRVTLDRDVEYWKAGDRLAVPGTQQQPRHKHRRFENQSEVVTIKSIEGRNVTFEPALKHDHPGVAENFNSKL